MLKPEDFIFFVGYVGWQLDQLREEMGSDYGYVAAYSPYVIDGVLTESSSGVWDEVFVVKREIIILN